MDGFARTGPKSAGLPSPQLARPFANPEEVISATRDGAVSVAIIDGPYDAVALSGILAKAPIQLGLGACGDKPNSACDHGTFVIGLLGARRDALIPGLCPGCQLLHIPIFIDEHAPWASVGELANAISIAVAAGARIINLSLAILGDNSRNHPELAAALNYAELKGAVVVVAAGNQGRLAMGQLLSHSVTVPVVAVDAGLGLLPNSNFGPVISRRGVAALGSNLPGYAPGGGTTAMSGTSVATAVASGTLAEVWSKVPSATAAEIRAAVLRLAPRNETRPPVLDHALLLAAINQLHKAAAAKFAIRESHIYAGLQGEAAMKEENGPTNLVNRGALPAMSPINVAAPANGSSRCTCGAPAGTCNCTGGNNSDFVYAIGTVEVEYPNVGVEREMQALAHTLLPASWQPNADVPMKPTEDRSWQHAVLSADKERTRYIARQLIWRLTVEDYPAFILRPWDPRDFDLLVDSLGRPKYPKPDGGDSETRTSGKKKAKPSIPRASPIGPPQDLDVVVGVTTGLPTPLGIEVLVDQIFQISAHQLAPGGLDFFAQLSDNYGLTDEDRAYNFLAARYTIAPYALDEIKELTLAGVPTISSRLSGNSGRVVRVIFTLRTAQAVEKKYFVRVDVSDRFPFIVTPWQKYLERGEAS